jgi:LuxR family transcriptional regulator, maltose regulon positive regulatory protein
MSDLPPPADETPTQVFPGLRLGLPRTIPKATSRSRLEQVVTQGLRRTTVCLVTAPAGFGKTTLVSQVLRSRAQPAAWVALKASANDPVIFWKACVDALQQIDPTLQRLPAHTTSFPIDLAALPIPITLVMDDYQTITNPLIHQQMTQVVPHLPDSFRVCILSRQRCPLNLARLQAIHQVTQLTAADLRFTGEEFEAFVRKTLGLTIDKPMQDTILRMSAGWPAVAHLLLQEHVRSPHPQPELDQWRMLGSLAGDYLEQEILAQLGEEERVFSQQIAILDRVDEVVCQAITGASETGSRLAVLEQHLLITPQAEPGMHGLQLHPVLRRMLQNRLQREQSALLQDLHQRAAAYFQAHERPSEAIDHLLQANVYAEAEQQITEQAVARLVAGEHQRLHNWLNALPPSRLHANPYLHVMLAWTDFMRGPFEQAQAALENDLTAPVTAGVSERELLRAEIALLQGDLQTGVFHAQQALQVLPETTAFWRGLALTILGYSHWLGGEMEAAHQSIARLSTTHSEGLQLIAACNQAAADFEQVLTSAKTDLSRYGLAAAVAHLSLGLVYYTWNRLETAAEAVREGLRLGQPWVYFSSVLPGYFLEAQIDTLRGRDAAARLALEHAETYIRLASLRPLQHLLEAHRARLQLLRGQLNPARRWALRLSWQETDPIDVNTIGRLMTYVQIMIASHEGQRIRPLLERLEVVVQSWGWGWMLLEVQLHRVLVDWSLGETSAALERLHSVLTWAEPEGHMRLFLDHGRLMESVLRHLDPPEHRSAYVQELLRCFEEEARFSTTVPLYETEVAPESPILSHREREVLQWLETGASNKAIADHLVITEGTVKTHIKSILRKLNVRSRTEAAAQAHKLHLI